MLGKKGCKLQTDLFGLVSRLFNAQYFLKTDFIGYRIVHNLNYV